MILTYQEQKKGMKYSWAFSETRSKESGQLRFSVTLDTLKDLTLIDAGGEEVIHPLLRRSAAISQGIIQMFSNFLTFSGMMLGPR